MALVGDVKVEQITTVLGDVLTGGGSNWQKVHGGLDFGNEDL